MEKKGDLLLNVSELRSLRKKIEEVYSEIHPADLQKLWRSNPDSYGILKDLIKERTGKDLSTRFLSRSLHLSIHSGNYASFRESNMDALYQFAYGDIRSKVFQSLINDHRNQTLYYLGNESEINAAVRKSLSLDFATIERNTEKISSLLVKAINEDDQVVRIYINKEYLESTVGIQDLIEVLSQNLQRSFFDTNIKFHFDKDLFKEKGLLTSEGFGTLEKYWAAKLASVESDHKKTYPDLVENEVKEYRLIESNLKRVCIALKQIHYQDPGPLQKTDEFSIEHFSPYLKNLKKLLPKPLDEIYHKALSAEETNNYLFLCVIAYDRFFDVKPRDQQSRIDRAYMLNYFLKFNKGLKAKGHTIERIFTLTGKFNKRKGWQSSMTYNENINLFSYAYINSLTTDQPSLILLYDPAKERREVLAKLDYVIRLDMTKEGLKDFSVDRIWTDIDFKPNFDSRYNQLYVAYPPAANGDAQMIEIIEKDDINRYYQDFRGRISYLMDEASPAFSCFKFSKKNLDDSIRLFGLNPNDKEVINIITEVNILAGIK